MRRREEPTTSAEIPPHETKKSWHNRFIIKISRREREVTESCFCYIHDVVPTGRRHICAFCLSRPISMWLNSTYTPAIYNNHDLDPTWDFGTLYKENVSSIIFAKIISGLRRYHISAASDCCAVCNEYRG